MFAFSGRVESIFVKLLVIESIFVKWLVIETLVLWYFCKKSFQANVFFAYFFVHAISSAKSLTYLKNRFLVTLLSRGKYSVRVILILTWIQCVWNNTIYLTFYLSLKPICLSLTLVKSPLSNCMTNYPYDRTVYFESGLSPFAFVLKYWNVRRFYRSSFILVLFSYRVPPSCK